MNTYKVKLGAFEAEYKAYETTAPVEYDGFGTISLHTDVGLKEPRWVLIRTEHEQWQTMRYRSGMYGAQAFGSESSAPALDDFEKWITEQLYKRLTQG